MGKLRKGVAVKCVETGQKYPSIREAARAHSITDLPIRRALRHGSIAAGRHWEVLPESVEVLTTEEVIKSHRPSRSSPQSPYTGVCSRDVFAVLIRTLSTYMENVSLKEENMVSLTVLSFNSNKPLTTPYLAT
eukprot:g20563.t1